ncbi:MAG TPA: hypothetical protein VF704_00115 [Allosphingosinicella sp.]|jgi:hypothetical protein
MEGSRAKLLVALCWAWVLLVAGYMIWGAIHHAALYGWLADLQLERWGSFRQDLTGIIPGFLLAAPALWYIRLRSQIALALEEPGPASDVRRRRRVARNVGIIGIVCGLVAGGAYTISQRMPDGSEEPTPLDLTALGMGDVPREQISIRGSVDPDVQTGIEESSRYVDRATLYVGFRLEGEAKDAPVRVFVERYFGNAADAGTAQGFMPDQTGYLVENGLPTPALRDLQRRGVTVASPHYLLRTGDDSRREIYYIVAALAGLVAVAALLVSAIGFLQARGLARRAGLA